MKSLLYLLWCCTITTALHGQMPTLALCTDKTTSLVFPHPVRHIDRGTGDVLVQPVKGAERILLVKAACEGFAETNLSVVTEDGSLYSFLVTYQKAPSVWTYEIPVKSSLPPATTAARLMDNPRTLYGVRDHAWGVTATLEGIYIQGSVLYFQLGLQNNSPLDYPIDYLRFALRDPQKARRTAVQEAEVHPLHLSGRISAVKAFSRQVLVAALPSFTLPGQMHLRIELGEGGGGRHLALKVGNRALVKALPLPHTK